MMNEHAAVELVCIAPATLDLTFTGLQSLPEPGQERFARGFLRSPGGGALHAIAAARLGVRTVAGFPLGDDDAGEVIRAALLEAGASVEGERTARTSVTVVMPVAGERAMVTFQPGDSVRRGIPAGGGPARVLCSLRQLESVPTAARAFVSLNGWDLDRCVVAGLPQSMAIDTLLVNEREAMTLTAAPDIEHAARQLAQTAVTVVVTRGARGAVACAQDEVVAVPGIEVDVVDTTGAGDLFAAAWVWGDVLGLDLRAKLRWAVLYAAISVTVPTGAAGAVMLDQLLAEGERRGMRLPVPDPNRAALRRASFDASS
jgi:sugar/nucleoside kinase (ribokinase family)